MALADLDEILIRATYSTSTAASSIAGVSMDVAVPPRPGLPPALEVEECRCPPGYRGLSCQVSRPPVCPACSGSVGRCVGVTVLSTPIPAPSCRTVPPATHVPGGGCTWGTASSASATATRRPATLRVASAL